VSYPPPSNGVIPPSRGTNPYAEQAVSAAPGGTYSLNLLLQKSQVLVGVCQLGPEISTTLLSISDTSHGVLLLLTILLLLGIRVTTLSLLSVLVSAIVLVLLLCSVLVVGTAWCGGDCLFGIWVGTSGWWDYAIGGRGVRHLLRGRSVTISLVCHSDV